LPSRKFAANQSAAMHIFGDPPKLHQNPPAVWVDLAAGSDFGGIVDLVLAGFALVEAGTAVG